MPGHENLPSLLKLITVLGLIRGGEAVDVM